MGLDYCGSLRNLLPWGILRAAKNHLSWVALRAALPKGRCMDQTLGKVDLEDIFSGVVSTELGPSLEIQRHRGRQDHMDKAP